MKEASPSRWPDVVPDARSAKAGTSYVGCDATGTRTRAWRSRCRLLEPLLQTISPHPAQPLAQPEPTSSREGTALHVGMPSSMANPVILLDSPESCNARRFITSHTIPLARRGTSVVEVGPKGQLAPECLRPASSSQPSSADASSAHLVANSLLRRAAAGGCCKLFPLLPAFQRGMAMGPGPNDGRS